MTIILIIISLLLEGLISINISGESYLFPLLTLTTIYLIYPLYRKKNKRYFILLTITGLIYDLLYTNLLFFHAILFLFIGISTKYIYKNYQQSIFKTLLYLVLIIIVYELTTVSIFFLFQATTITFNKIIYKISHSLLLNLIYASLLTQLLKIKS